MYKLLYLWVTSFPPYRSTLSEVIFAPWWRSNYSPQRSLACFSYLLAPLIALGAPKSRSCLGIALNGTSPANLVLQSTARALYRCRASFCLLLQEWVPFSAVAGFVWCPDNLLDCSFVCRFFHPPPSLPLFGVLLMRGGGARPFPAPQQGRCLLCCCYHFLTWDCPNHALAMHFLLRMKLSCALGITFYQLEQ